MELRELEDEVGKVLGLKAREVKWVGASVNLSSKDLVLTLLIKADSIKGKRIKALMVKATNGES